MTEEKKKFGGKQEGAGRPPKEINWTLFEDLCSLQCTQSEICSVLHVHDDTLRSKVKEYYEEDYSAAYKRFSEGGKSSLRRIQLNLAKKNPGMAIFLGKQWLGQKDNHDVVQISPEMAQQYEAVMNQLKQMQKAPALSA